jgi:hypothetical protein
MVARTNEVAKVAVTPPLQGGSRERSFGVGLNVLSSGAAALIALTSLIWPHVVHPFVLFGLCGIGMAVGTVMMWHASRETSPLLLSPDTSIAHAIDYVVNESKVRLKQDPAPERSVFGPTKGRMVQWVGKPHSDATQQIEQRLRLGALVGFGRRAMTPGGNPTSFESTFRRIPESYWDGAQLHPLFARVDGSQFPQTAFRAPGVEDEWLYTDVRVNLGQLCQLWRRKTLVRRLIDRIRRIPRIDDPMFSASRRVASGSESNAETQSEAAYLGRSRLD